MGTTKDRKAFTLRKREQVKIGTLVGKGL